MRWHAGSTMSGPDHDQLTARDIGDLHAAGACIKVVERKARLALAGAPGHDGGVPTARLRAVRAAADELEQATLRLLDDLDPQLGERARDVASLARAEIQVDVILSPSSTRRDTPLRLV